MVDYLGLSVVRWLRGDKAIFPVSQRLADIPAKCRSLGARGINVSYCLVVFFVTP